MQNECDNFVANIHDEDYEKAFAGKHTGYRQLIFTGGRVGESLASGWRYAIDPYDSGLRSGWHRPVQTNPGQAVLPWDYSTGEGETCSLPVCWNLVAGELFHYEGTVWFSRSFACRKQQQGERLFLRIGAANYEARLFLNHKFIAAHSGGSTPFCVELTPYLEEHNMLQVCVNNNRTADRVPMKNCDWFNWGGIYREVELFRLPAVFLSGFNIHLHPDGTCSRLAIAVELSGAGAEEEVLLEIPELQVKQQLLVVNGVYRGLLPAAPVPWSPANPKLYAVTVKTGVDSITDMVGFREISVKGREILLNGKSLFLKGVSVHEDDVQLGKAASRADLERRFAHARELGANFLRLAHYPHHEMASRLADQYGILLWEEIPVYWAINFDNPATYLDAENQLLELIRRDYNRASVILWSVGNENPDTDSRLSFMQRLAAKAREADPSRLVTAACLVNKKKLLLEDRLAECLDVISLNEYYGWYDPGFDGLAALLENSRPAKPVIISEFGADARAGNHGSPAALFTEEYMEQLYEKQLDILSRFSYIRGVSPWILYDFHCPRRQNHYQQGFNRKGLIAEDKQTRKKAFYVLQRHYLQ